MLSQFGQYPALNSILIINNVSIHHSSIKTLLYIVNIKINFLWIVKELCAKYRVWVEYFPSYSSDYNLIEKFFYFVKYFLKKYYKEYKEKLWVNTFLQMAIEQFSLVNIAKTH